MVGELYNSYQLSAIGYQFSVNSHQFKKPG